MEAQGQIAGRILVVDDEPSVGRVLEQWLTRRGYRVRYASGFTQARQHLGAEEFDLVTLDIVMPEASGLEVLRWLRAEYPDLGVIMATALTDLDSVLEAMRLGALNYLIKPFNLHLISAEIERAMERQRLIAENRSYQRELEHKVEQRTRELADAYDRLRAAHGQLELRVRELEGSDRLVHFQMALHSMEEACAEVASVIYHVVQAQRVALYRAPGEGGELALVCCAPAAGEDPGPQACRLAGRALATGQVVDGEEGELGAPVVYRDDALAALWVRLAGASAVPRREAAGALLRLAGEAALVLRGALVAEDLERGALQVEGLEDIE
ncbi:MAG: response regulator [Candidatus Latescibacterota bacterium]